MRHRDDLGALVLSGKTVVATCRHAPDAETVEVNRDTAAPIKFSWMLDLRRSRVDPNGSSARTGERPYHGKCLNHRREQRDRHRTVKYALEAGHTVRALAQSARRIPVDHPKLTKVSADARDQTAVAGALEGVDAVIQALGIPGRDMMLRPVHLFSDATRVLIASMKERGRSGRCGCTAPHLASRG